jgi:uncharacterized damage-inducible protein DinB
MSHSETARISNQLKQAFEGGAWHGPSVREILAGVDARVAAARPVPGAHTIWEIVGHLVATQRMLLRRLQGDATASDLPAAEEWPPAAETGEEAWRELMLRLESGDSALRNRIEAFPEGRLDEPLIPGGSSAYNNFHGYLQHNLYHAAQIGLLRKIQAA